ncbi:TlpA disulfide reductase family protein [uncultured Psychroserpens sp.]|uniref:TlpA family protein disulfide reductase n=1 Tax=uncultured Psychroserpens sp. TaxID=255436 RepID=UPI00263938CA|nr:TlpA disulfide reductase family protein [uncultured Psychroserpens sp.]
MARSKKVNISNLIFIVALVLLLIPQTRQPIQIFLNKAIAAIVKPSVIDASERQTLSNYDWILKDVSGNDFDFHYAEGKVVIINFWATWCPPCIAEMPSLNELYQHYIPNDDVVFLFVSNEDKELLYEFMTHNSYSFQVYQSLSDYPKVFNVSSIPRTFIINKKGEIVIDKTGAADWNSERVRNAIDQALKAF